MWCLFSALPSVRTRIARLELDLANTKYIRKILCGLYLNILLSIMPITIM